MAVRLPEVSVAEIGVTAVHDAAEIAAPRWRRDLELWLPAGFLALLVGACFLWPLIDHSLPSPVGGQLQNANVPPLSRGALFGTDNLGNDIFSRILYGGRVSIEVGLGANLIGLCLGGYYGVFAAFKGGLIEATMMRILDMFLAFPALILAIVVSQFLGPSELHVIFAISFFSVPAFARIARAQTLRLREQTYVTAARLSGRKDRAILFGHVIPNVVPNLLTFGLLGIPIVIIVEAALSFLGYGVPPPGPSWGNMLAVGQSYLSSNPDLVIIPAAFLIATVLSLNLVGDAVRDRWASR
ncbi:MAG TPA: ABC transporter permease [Acidimicrobiales bacterium]|nr:ABC transporter permease [Acidimicrobiales bacterium]